jgi:photosystem II stability/assembly factor-like uncharacterized protein
VAVGGTYGGYGVVLRSTDGGVTWTREPVPVGTYRLSDVDCPTAMRCEAVVLSAQYQNVQVIGSGDGGRTWTVQQVDPGVDLSDFETVKCSSAQDCIATGFGSQGEATVLATTDAGASWSVISPFGLVTNAGVEGVHCASSLACLITGWESAPNGATIGVSSSTSDGGLTWSAGVVPGGVQVVWDVACASALVCEAPSRTATGSVVLHTTDGGATWTEQAIPTGSQPYFIVCPAALTCFASGYFTPSLGANQGLLLATTDGGSSWSRVALPSSGDARGLSCPSASTCVVPAATGAGVPEFFNVSNGIATRGPALALGMTSVRSLTCGSAVSCVAVGSIATSRGEVGGLLTTSTAGTSWTALATPSSVRAFTGVSCPSATTCIAVGQDNQSGVIVTTTNHGATWSTTPVAIALSDVSCATLSTCVIVGNGAMYRSPGTKERWRTAKVPASVWQLNAVSCATAEACVAVGYNQAGGAATVWTNDGGRDWHNSAHVSSDFQMSSVQCLTTTLCTAAGTNIASFGVAGAGVIERSTDGGAHWAIASVPATTPGLVSGACLNAATCLAVGTSLTGGIELHSSDRGAHWSYTAPPRNVAYVESMTCGRSGCWVVGISPSGVIELEAAR